MSCGCPAGVLRLPRRLYLSVFSRVQWFVCFWLLRSCCVLFFVVFVVSVFVLLICSCPHVAERFKHFINERLRRGTINVLRASARACDGDAMDRPCHQTRNAVIPAGEQVGGAIQAAPLVPFAIQKRSLVPGGVGTTVEQHFHVFVPYHCLNWRVKGRIR